MRELINRPIRMHGLKDGQRTRNTSIPEGGRKVGKGRKRRRNSN